MRVSLIAAIGKRRELGKGNALLWRIPDDLKRFREKTRGHSVIIGRKTFDSIIAARGAPLPDRVNIVVTRTPGWAREGAVAASSLPDALQRAAEGGADEAFVIGGAQIYAEALPRAERLYLTLIDDEKEADAFFPPYEQDFPKIIREEAREWGGIRYRWVDLGRVI